MISYWLDMSMTWILSKVLYWSIHEINDPTGYRFEFRMLLRSANAIWLLGFEYR